MATNREQIRRRASDAVTTRVQIRRRVSDAVKLARKSRAER